MTTASAQINRIALPRRLPEIEDLMDKVTLESGNSNSQPVLERISQQINAFLFNEDCANSTLTAINENTRKIAALHQQLLHHNTQAKANSENLEKHIDYLLGQLLSLKALNSDLSQLDLVNSQSVEEVHTSLNAQKMHLDDIVTPDLTLVHQLYDVSAEIKAYKDAIGLVGGNFRSEGELVTDHNLDSCIKTVRGLAREMFWLEVVKAEIGKAMGLH